MLVLTRKIDQSIMIGDDVEITVLAVSGEKVRIGIAAPREIGVFRKEVYISSVVPSRILEAEQSGKVSGAQQ